MLRCRGNEQHPSRSRRFLPVGASGLRRLLGVPVRLVELDRNIFAELRLWRPAHGLSARLHPRSHGGMEMGRGCVRALPVQLLEYQRNPDRWWVGHRPTIRDFAPRRMALHRFSVPLALQPGVAFGPTWTTLRQRVGEGPRARHVELCWL